MMHNQKEPNCKCQVCGTAFRTTPFRISEGRGKFCSKRCQYSETPEQRFWKYVNKTDGCWLWTSVLHKGGYGHLAINRRMVKTHRLSWEIHNGPIPKGMHVLHRCDTPACVNPSHLFLGTHQDNMADMVRKGRVAHTCGERQGNSKMTQEQVISMRRLRSETKMTCREIGKMFNTTTSNAKDICGYRSWRHVPQVASSQL